MTIRRGGNGGREHSVGDRGITTHPCKQYLQRQAMVLQQGIAAFLGQSLSFEEVFGL
jgi:hypothetical protein